MTKFKNPRMALSTHVTGLMVGIYSLSLAAIADFIDLEGLLASLAVWTHILGNLFLVISLGLSALWNTQSMTPIVGSKQYREKRKESVVKWGITVSSIALTVSVCLILIGAIVR